MFHTRNRANEAAEASQITSKEGLIHGIVDELIPEPIGPAHRFPEDTIQSTYHIISKWVDRLSTFSKNTIFYRPLSVGIAEHHMAFPGTMTLRVNTFIGVLTDVVNSMIRSGITKILFINGHGGNTEPMRTAMQNINLEMKGLHSEIDTSEVRTHIDYMELLDQDSKIDIRYTSYWEMHDPNFIKKVINDTNYPGHANEYETSVALHMFPDLVDKEAIKIDPLGTSSDASEEKGKLIYDDIIE